MKIWLPILVLCLIAVALPIDPRISLFIVIFLIGAAISAGLGKGAKIFLGIVIIVGFLIHALN